MAEEIVDKMIAFGETHLLGIGRGSWGAIETHWKADKGPCWAHDGLITEKDVPRLKKGGIVCVGLLSVLLRHVGQRLPFLNPSNFPAYAKYNDWKDPDQDSSWHSPHNEGIQFGYGGSDEWMYIYHYVKHTMKRFDVDGKYPRGTLLFRVFSPYDGGHVAILRESSYKKALMDCTVLHTAGDQAGENKVTKHETVRRQHEMYSRGKTWAWDTDKEFVVDFGGTPYYTHVLLPEDYLDVIDEGSKKTMNANGGRDKMFKF